ncbi:MAG: hypothetical protein IKU52_07545 [Clostridia bacterium]|nr:hypothetical protein [Clostridia bacterium]
MAICDKCGKEYADTELFCEHCGEPAKAPKVTEAVEKSEDKETEKSSKRMSLQNFKGFLKIIDGTKYFKEEDIQKNKIFALFAYLGILFLIPMFACKGSKFARFHTNQGIVLCILDVICALAIGILEVLPVILLIFLKGVFWKILFGLITAVIGVVGAVAGIGLTILMVLGIISAVTGKAKKLPIIGNIRILK